MVEIPTASSHSGQSTRQEIRAEFSNQEILPLDSEREFWSATGPRLQLPPPPLWTAEPFLIPIIPVKHPDSLVGNVEGSIEHPFRNHSELTQN